LRRAVLSVAILVLPLAGCGGSESSGPSARETVNAYLAALSARDAARLCGMYSIDYRDVVERESGRVSARNAVPAPSGRSRLTALREDGDEAEATVTCEDSTASDCTLHLVREDGRWRIDGSLSPND
jgi:hypothetical protein